MAKQICRCATCAAKKRKMGKNNPEAKQRLMRYTRRLARNNWKVVGEGEDMEVVAVDHRNFYWS